MTRLTLPLVLSVDDRIPGTENIDPYALYVSLKIGDEEERQVGVLASSHKGDPPPYELRLPNGRGVWQDWFGHTLYVSPDDFIRAVADYMRGTVVGES